MKKTLINILVIVIVAGLAWFAKGQFDPEVRQTVRTDTVRVDVPYEVERVKEVEKPVTVTEYKTRYDTVKTVKVSRDTVYLSTSGVDLTYNSRFLTNYPLSPKFLGLQFANRELTLNYFTTEGKSEAQTWNVGDKNYRIGLNRGQPRLKTWKKDPQVSFYGEVGGMLEYSNGIKVSPYLQLDIERPIFGIDTRATININRNPFVKLGMRKEL